MSIRQGEKCVYRLDIFLLACTVQFLFIDSASKVEYFFICWPDALFDAIYDYAKRRAEEREREREKDVARYKIIASVSMILHLS